MASETTTTTRPAGGDAPAGPIYDIRWNPERKTLQASHVPDPAEADWVDKVQAVPAAPRCPGGEAGAR